MTATRLKLIGQVLAIGLVAGLIALLGWSLVADGEEAAARGPAPEWTLPRLDGKGELSLASLRGKAVVINFWASWCDPCEEEAQELEAAWRKYRARGLVVVGVDAHDFDGDAREFVREHGATYPIVYDGQGKTLEPYGVEAFPETYFVDRRGRLVAERIQGPVDANAETVRRFEASIRRALGRA